MQLRVSNLAVLRSGRSVISQLGFTVNAGEALALTGPNGSGKSTLLRVLAGLLPTSAGTIDWSGGQEDVPLSEEAHYLGHRDALKPALTPLELLTFWRSLLGRAATEPLAALERVGLAHAAYLPSAYLSAGQRRRLSLARLLVAHRPLWLLDEPTAALDQASETMFGALVADHLTRGGLALIATHAPLPDSDADFISERRIMSAFWALIRRDLLIAMRIGGGAGVGLVFFLMLVTIMPFAIGPDLVLLARIGPAILWVAALLATLIGLDRLFQADEEDGSLDLLRMAHLPLPLVVLAKVIAHWLMTGLPLALAAPFLGLLLAMEPQALLAVTVTLLVGTPALTFIGATGAALTAGLRRGGLILAVLVMPLMIPVLIFGISATSAALGGPVPFHTPFAILCGLGLFALVTGTISASLALRASDS